MNSRLVSEKLSEKNTPAERLSIGRHFRSLSGRCVWASVVLSVLLSSILPIQAGELAADDDTETVRIRATKLNNEGVVAMHNGAYDVAIKKLGEAVTLDRDYDLALKNLAIAHNNYAVSLPEKPQAVTLRHFRLSLYLYPGYKTVEVNLNHMLRGMGLDPTSFDVRVRLGDKARKDADYLSAAVEYVAALQLKANEDVSQKLTEMYVKLNRTRRPYVPAPAADCCSYLRISILERVDLSRCRFCLCANGLRE